jgi:hypothetical protein
MVCPKALPMVPFYQSDPSRTFCKACLLYRGRLHLPVVQPLLCPLVEWWFYCVQEPQHQVVDILEFTETKNHAVGVG